jgi:hypothetical protein
MIYVLVFTLADKSISAAFRFATNIPAIFENMDGAWCALIRWTRMIRIAVLGTRFANPGPNKITSPWVQDTSGLTERAA